MNKSSSLVKFYKNMLHSLNVESNDESRLSLVISTGDDGDDLEQKCLANGKRVVLPSNDLLKSGDWTGMIPFHPLSENLLRGESEIIHFLRNIIQFRLAGVIGILTSELLDIAASPKEHVDMSPSECEYLSLVPDVDDKTLKVLDKVLKNGLGDMVKVYLKRNGTLKGKEHRRVASVNFPIWDELTSEGTKIYRTSAGNKKNKKAIADLFNYVIPNAGDRDLWSTSSDSDIAPYFHALLRSYAHVAEHLNSLVDKHERMLSNPDQLRSDLGWIKDINRMSKWRDVIPALPGNEGATVKGDAEPAATHAVRSSNIKTSSVLSHAAASAANLVSSEAPEVANDIPWDTSNEKNHIVSPAVHAPVTHNASASGETTMDWRQVMLQRGVQSLPAAPVPMAMGVQPVPAQNMGYRQPYPVGRAAPMQPMAPVNSGAYYQNSL